MFHHGVTVYVIGDCVCTLMDLIGRHRNISKIFVEIGGLCFDIVVLICEI